jgi:hypothetical protein
MKISDLRSIPPSKDIFLLTRGRDRKDRSIRDVADEIVRMFEQARKIFVRMTTDDLDRFGTDKLMCEQILLRADITKNPDRRPCL